MKARFLVFVFILAWGWAAPPPSPAAGGVAEDFAAMANGERDTNGNDRLDLGDEGARTNGWQSRGIYWWSIEAGPEDGRNVLTLPAGSGPVTWNSVGKPHGQSLEGVRSIDLAVEVLEAADPARVWAWASDGMQNGYGLEFTCRDNVVRILKLRDNLVAFNREAKEQVRWSAPEGEASMLGKIKVPGKVPAGMSVTLHLRVAQKEPGGPVTLTVWNTSPWGGLETDARNPLAQVVDDGSGLEFAAPGGDFGAPLDLAGLTHVAVSGMATKTEALAIARVELKVSP